MYGLFLYFRGAVLGLRQLCIKNNWFTSGSNEQYEKLFYANENGCPIKEIATIIWLCSNEEVRRIDVLAELKEARKSYLKKLRKQNEW